MLTRGEIEKHIHDCADEQFYMDDGKTTQPRQKELGFLIDMATLALRALSITAELEEARKERDTLQAANRAMGELLGQCQRHMHHCDESDSKILEIRIQQALNQTKGG